MNPNTGLGQAYKPSFLRYAGAPFVFVKRRVEKKDAQYDSLKDKEQKRKQQRNSSSSRVDIKV